MNVVEVRGNTTHRLRVTVRRRRPVVTPCCAHPDAEEVLAALAGRDLGCESSAHLLRYLLGRGLEMDEAARWAALPVKPWRPHWQYRWKATPQPWTLSDLDHWFDLGWTPESAARFCAVRPMRKAGRLS